MIYMGLGNSGSKILWNFHEFLFQPNAVPEALGRLANTRFLIGDADTNNSVIHEVQGRKLHQTHPPQAINLMDLAALLERRVRGLSHHWRAARRDGDEGPGVLRDHEHVRPAAGDAAAQRRRRHGRRHQWGVSPAAPRRRGDPAQCPPVRRPAGTRPVPGRRPGHHGTGRLPVRQRRPIPPQVRQRRRPARNGAVSAERQLRSVHPVQQLHVVRAAERSLPGRRAPAESAVGPRPGDDARGRQPGSIPRPPPAGDVWPGGGPAEAAGDRGSAISLAGGSRPGPLRPDAGGPGASFSHGAVRAAGGVQQVQERPQRPVLPGQGAVERAGAGPGARLPALHRGRRLPLLQAGSQ